MAKLSFLYNNLAASATITSSDENANFPDDNAVDVRPKREFHSADDEQDVYLNFDLGSALAVRTVALINVNFTSGKIQADDNSDYGSLAVDQALAFTQGGDTLTSLQYTFSEDKTYRYWRFKISSQAVTLGYYKVGVAVLGEKYTFTKNMGYPYKRYKSYAYDAIKTRSGDRKVFQRFNRNLFHLNMNGISAADRSFFDDMWADRYGMSLPALFVPDYTQPAAHWVISEVEYPFEENFKERHRGQLVLEEMVY